MSFHTSKLDAAPMPGIALGKAIGGANLVGGIGPSPPTSLRVPRAGFTPAKPIIHQPHISLASRPGLVLSADP
ncbi:MAG TPA: hypothetical protein PKA58_16165 [Polyangium sp.]|nr:hypothetical protein [Polyangium sp.]